MKSYVDQGFGTIYQTLMQISWLDVHCKLCQQYHMEDPCNKLFLLQALETHEDKFSKKRRHNLHDYIYSSSMQDLPKYKYPR